jgi:hypothetical protein
MASPPPTRRGYDAYEAISALQKAIRRSDVDAATYWSCELVLSDYGAWCWSRLREIAAEDVSPTATGLIADVATLSNQWKQPRKAGDYGLLLVVRAVIALAIAPKSRIADWATVVHASGHVPRREIPDEALDRHTRRGKQMGRGWEHFIEEASRLVEFDGDLEQMSAGYRDQFRRATEKDPTLPSNLPTGQNSQHGYGSGPTTGPTQQLALDDEEDR